MLFQYERELAGGARLGLFRIESRVLRGNPLGDPAERHNPLLLPAGGGGGRPLVLVLGGFLSFGHRVLNVATWQENLPERIARLTAAGRLPPAVYLWPSCETRYGGSQYMNSPGTGRYEDFLRDELVPAVERAHGCGGPSRRAAAGKSSGGYGALTLAMRNPGWLAAAASHAGDMAFELCFHDVLNPLNVWRRHGGVEGFLRALPALRIGTPEVHAMCLIAMAAVWSPNPAVPLGFDLPVDPDTGEHRPAVWARWLEHDPVRMAERPACAAALAQLRALYLDAGDADEYGLHWGLRRMQAKLTAAGVPHHAEFFAGGHYDADARYESSLPRLLGALDGSAR